MRNPVRALLVVILLATSLASAEAETLPRFPEGIRGVTLSTHGDGRDWASAELIGPAMEEIRRVGGGWIAFHPYARVREDGSVRFFSMHADGAQDHVRRPIEVAHRLGLKVLVKPHLAYWGSKFRWRGEIEFADDATWEWFWNEYERFIVRMAELSADADGFVVGTELDRTLGQDERWRRIVARVREKTRAPLTYAANWTDYERVGFWDALDAVGIQAYFPVADTESPDEATVRAGWEKVMAGLAAFAERTKRPIVFTELGYNHSFAAALRPWEAKTDGEDAVPLQRACLRIALEAVEREPAVLGSFLWKWFPEPRPVGRDFRLATPDVKQVLADVWAEGS